MAPRATFDLVIFDCDGVLVDSEPIANRVDTEQLNSIGLRLSSEEIMRRFVGRTKEGCIALAAELLGRDLPGGFVDRWDAALMDALGKEVRAIEGVTEVIRQLEIPYCAASNSTPGRLRLSLKTSGLLPLFEGRMFSAEEVAHPKPAPDLFLHAARCMGAAPVRCAVIEDTPTGARAGAAAGMTVLGFAGNAHANVAALEAEGATVFKSMTELASLLGGKQ
jgi:HAD superfamily hydrolase (TIGR01509 family)